MSFSDRKRVMILVTDEEWDIKNLANGFGSGLTTRDEVCQHLHEVTYFNFVFPDCGLYCIYCYNYTRTTIYKWNNPYGFCPRIMYFVHNLTRTYTWAFGRPNTTQIPT